MKARRFSRGLTLIEVLVAISILTMISVLLYTAFSGLKNSKDGISRLNDRYHEGRSAMRRIGFELQTAFLSGHIPIDLSLLVNQTAFLGVRGSPTARVDFTAFANHRFDQGVRQSDQAEVAYFGSPNPDEPDVTDLVRRLSPRIDLEPDRGGRVEVLATDISAFELRYYDPLIGDWIETWDTTQDLRQPNRLPLYVEVRLLLNGGRRSSFSGEQNPIEFMSKVMIPIREPLTFATAR
jgi:general secretion pathway protein J